MSKIIDLDALSVTERLDLIAELWDGIAAHPENVQVDTQIIDELGGRRAEYERDPSTAVRWEDLRDRILSHRTPATGIVDQVRDILERSFPGIEQQLEEWDDGRVGGDAVWSGFTDVDHVDRQNMLRNAICSALGEDVTRIGLVLAYTPDELCAMRAA